MPQAPVAGTIISVTDGDEVRADVEGFGITEVRFAYVDAPEYDQAGGAEAKDALKALVNRPGTKAKFAVKKRDKYGRLIATVFTAGVVLEEVLLEQGHAWAMKKYLPPVLKERYAKLENEARRDKRGLWGRGEKPIPPWEWRQRGTTQKGERQGPRTAVHSHNDRADTRAPRWPWIAAVAIIGAIAIAGKSTTQSGSTTRTAPRTVPHSQPNPVTTVEVRCARTPQGYEGPKLAPGSQVEKFAVERGDTWWELASERGQTIEFAAALNAVEGDTARAGRGLRAGDVIWVAGEGTKLCEQ